MSRTRSRYDICQGDLLEITCWFDKADVPATNYHHSVELVLVISDYGPHDEVIEILDPKGQLAYTIDAYITRQYPGAR